METRPRTWLVRNVRQVWDGGERRLGISLEMVPSATSMPSLRSSPWILRAPHRGLAAAIRVTRARTSALTGGRPTVGRPDSLVQWSRKRRRRHRRMVSGATMTRACRHPAHTLDSQTQKGRSLLRSFGPHATDQSRSSEPPATTPEPPREARRRSPQDKGTDRDTGEGTGAVRIRLSAFVLLPATSQEPTPLVC
jgi:hypothetical protein